MNNYDIPVEKMWACPEAIKWLKKYETLQRASIECKRADWLLYIIAFMKSGNPETADRKKIVSVTMKCVKLAIDTIGNVEDDVTKAIEDIEKYINGSGISAGDMENIFNTMISKAYEDKYSKEQQYLYASIASIATMGYGNNKASLAISACYAIEYACASAKKWSLYKQSSDIIRECYTYNEVIKTEGVQNGILRH